MRISPDYCPGLQRSSRVAPWCSPQGIADAFGISVSRAGNLLARATELDLIVEVSGRKAWRLYLVPDLAIAFGFKPAPRGRRGEIGTVAGLDGYRNTMSTRASVARTRRDTKPKSR